MGDSSDWSISAFSLTILLYSDLRWLSLILFSSDPSADSSSSWTGRPIHARMT